MGVRQPWCTHLEDYKISLDFTFEYAYPKKIVLHATAPHGKAQQAAASILMFQTDHQYTTPIDVSTHAASFSCLHSRKYL